jgi:transcriptional regulator with XRE-family HTH domain
MNERERQIAGRVRRVRYSNQLSQPRFADALEISLHRLAGIEYGRTPLRASIADKIGAKFDVSLVWLAEGRGRMNPCGGLISVVRPEIKPGELLSRACTSELKKAFQDHSFFSEFCFAAILTGVAGLPKGKNIERYLLGLHHAIDESFQDLPHEGREKLLNVMVRALASFACDRELGAEDPGQSEHANSKNSPLQNLSETDKYSHMGPLWPKFQERVKKATEQRGQKTALAKFLDVPLSSVSQWLSGDREPGGETTLRMLRWVELQQGRQSK